MVALRRTLAVNCRRCGRSVERVRRADDIRSAAQLLQSGRCGFCRARACDGDVEIIPVETPIKKHPGFILEPDGNLRPRSRRNGGNASARPKLTVVASGSPPPPPQMSHATGALFAASIFSAAAVLAFALVLILAPVILAVGHAAGRAFDVATSQPARELTYDLSDPLERDTYCHGRAYLIDIRGANVPEDVRELRRNVIRNCPELAARR